MNIDWGVLAIIAASALLCFSVGERRDKKVNYDISRNMEKNESKPTDL